MDGATSRRSTDSKDDDSDDEFNIESGDALIEEPFSGGFSDFYDYGSDELYQSSNLSVIQTLAILFTWFSSFPGISKEAFGRLLYVLRNFLLPGNNKLPDSYAKAFTMIKHLLLPVEVYDCCVNDCIVFRKSANGDFTNLTRCPAQY